MTKIEGMNVTDPIWETMQAQPMATAIVQGGQSVSYGALRATAEKLCTRLLRAGVARKDGSFATGVIHLWHAEADRSHLADNDLKLAGVVDSDRIRAQQGLSALTFGGAVSKAAGKT